MRKILILLIPALLLNLPAVAQECSLNEQKDSNEFLNESDLSNVKVISLYQSVIDGIPPDRGIDGIIEILEETKTDFVFRIFWKGPGATDLSLYDELRDAINEIKKRIPDIVLCGSIPTQNLWKTDRNLINGEWVTYPKTWEMALDPSKWGIPMSKEEFQCLISKGLGHIEDCDHYDPEKAKVYFPDITNPDFQELFLSWAYKQIDCGVDAIWIDMTFMQSFILMKLTGDPNHPAVKQSFNAMKDLIDKIHEYGVSKGRYIYVGARDIPEGYSTDNVDFVTFSPSRSEILNMSFNEIKWESLKERVKDGYGNIPIFVFIDWYHKVSSPLGTFSQRLDSDQQNLFLRKADRFFCIKGMNFIYPVHGGYMGHEAEKLSFGKYRVYDSLAPEFDTYETIKELARNKAEGKPFVEIERPRNYIYIFDREILPCAIPLIIGKITIKVDAFDLDGIEKVEFYVDDSLKFTDYETPYEWLWNERIVGFHMIRIIAYDAERKYSEEEIKVLIFNFG